MDSQARAAAVLRKRLNSAGLPCEVLGRGSASGKIWLLAIGSLDTTLDTLSSLLPLEAHVPSESRTWLP